MKVELHQALTRRALEIYEYQKSIGLSPDLKKDIIDGTKAEDNWWEPSRWFNWHFYYQNEDIDKYTKILRMRRTSDYIFKKRVEEMKASKTNSKKYGRSIGRVLHHIQDMHTPSHVVPIYHIGDDHLESFMVDALDDKKLDPIIPAGSWKEFTTLKEQYKIAAKNTFQFIKETKMNVTSDHTDKTLGLSVFWQDHDQHEDPKRSGFGTFSEAQAVFKKTKQDQYDTDFKYEGKSYHIALDEMYKICNLISGRAIRETIRTLDHLNL